MLRETPDVTTKPKSYALAASQHALTGHEGERGLREGAREIESEGEMIRLETLIELKFLNSSFSSLSSYWN